MLTKRSKLAIGLDFPLLVRPSYVLGGQGMKIVINEQELEEHVVNLLKEYSRQSRCCSTISWTVPLKRKPMRSAMAKMCTSSASWSISSRAGIHSGDSNAALPPFNLGEFVMQQIEDHTKKIALALQTVGLINIQFAIKDDMVYIIEANPRASRTVPFIAKAYGEPYVNYATKVMLGEKKVKDFKFNPHIERLCDQAAGILFSKFPNVNKELGPEMKSTGESILFIDDLKDDAVL